MCLLNCDDLYFDELDLNCDKLDFDILNCEF